MKKARRRPEQIIEILRQVEAGKAAGKPVAQLCKEAGVVRPPKRFLDIPTREKPENP